MVKNPDAACRPLRRGERGVEIGVDIEADRVGFPFDGVKMKVVGETLARGKLENGSKVTCAAGSAGAMQGTVNGGGFLADIFHDVDLAALGPAHGRDVLAEHPQRGPHSLPCRDFDSCLEAAISLREEALRFEACGRVSARHAVGAGVVLFLRRDYQIPFFSIRVLKATGVVLELLIAPAVAADGVGPLLRVWRRAVRAGEFVPPNHSPAGAKLWHLRIAGIEEATTGEQRN